MNNSTIVKDNSKTPISDSVLPINDSQLSEPVENAKVLRPASKELLSITGDGSRASIIKSLIKKKRIPPKTKKLQTYKTTRSPLFDKLEAFIPKIKDSTQELLSKSEDERKSLDLENVDGCNKVVEMNLLIGQMDDSNSENESSNEDESKNSITEPSIKVPKSASLSEKRKILIEEIKSASSKES